MSCVTCATKLLGWFPLVFVNGIILWSYFTYVIVLCVYHVKNPLERGLYLGFFHPIFVMFMVSYWKAILSTPGYVPSQFYLSSQDLENYNSSGNPQDVLNELVKELPVITRSDNNEVRFCKICTIIKPDRSHHCSECKRCILKMDHHCPWINNCVGWKNYKLFLLFLWYTILYTMFIVFTSFQYFINFWTSYGQGIQVLILFCMAAVFLISCLFLLGYHIWFCVKNRTTLEYYRPPIFQNGPNENGFNIGGWSNIYEVFGKKKSKWLLPVFSALGDGIHFSIRCSLDTE